MNTGEVAKLLGVSVSTIQRWIKQLDLQMERNERGHYFFREEDINVLKKIHDQLQNGILLQEITPPKDKTVRRGTIKTAGSDEAIEMLNAKIKSLEKDLDGKADSVVSYQLLQHRREIEELQSHVTELSQQIERLQLELAEMKEEQLKDKPMVLNNGKVKRKKKNFVSSLFGF
ncbi:MerR family transcriptional regulator [Neobacillus dielmonensis]|uniref:MerR family transcriptional regulator n=1 Tax=Neobacillus dielmonensis TaxID=1347369 RepID=UPI0005A62977|nr:MerR family transcriptional regulator [Neobacillus dielmonensis]